MPGMDDARHLFDRLPSPGKRLALVAAVLVHVLLALFLIYGIRWQNTAPVAVEVELVGNVPQPAPAPPPPPVAKTPPKPAPLPAPPPPKKVTPPKPDIAIKDKPEKKPEPKPEPKPEKKPEPKPAPKYDPVKEMLRQEAEQKKRDQLAEALAREDGKSTAVDAAAARKGLADYSDKIRARIRSNIFAPPGATGNPEVEFVITQIQGAEGGIITDVKLRKSSGQPALDEAVERAIRKSSPLPLPERKEDFTRTLILKLWPLEKTSLH